jgi:hypothetical protein
MITKFRTQGIGLLVVLLFSSFFTAGDCRADDKKIQFTFTNTTQRCILLDDFGSEVRNLKLPPGAVVDMMLTSRNYKPGQMVALGLAPYKHQECEGEHFATSRVAIILGGRPYPYPVEPQGPKSLSLITYQVDGTKAWKVEISE